MTRRKEHSCSNRGIISQKTREDRDAEHDNKDEDGSNCVMRWEIMRDEGVIVQMRAMRGILR